MSDFHNSIDQSRAEAHGRLIEQMRRILGDEICAVFEDPKAVEIMLNDDGKILVERHGSGITQLTTLSPSKAVNFLSLMASYRETTVGKDKPIVEGAMPDEFRRARFAGCIPPLTPLPTFSIRLPTTQIFTLADYVSAGIMTDDEKTMLEQAIEDRKNIVVSGGTGCFAKGHPIRLLNGTDKPVEQVVVGDVLMGPDGKARKVIDTHTGLDHMVRVVLHSGRGFVVNQSHRLALVPVSSTGHFCCIDGVQPVTRTVMEWTRESRDFKHRHRLFYADFQAGAASITASIVEMQSVGKGAYYGFEVDHPDHLFVDGHGMVQGNSGKTTLLNALSSHVAEISGLDQRVIIVEDTREIVCQAPNTVQMLTNPDADIDMTRLVKLTLRYRPDRIFVGEVRDGAALALLDAWNTGHPGGLATVHANDPHAALIRLDTLCQRTGVPPQMALIREAVGVVVQILKDKNAPAGRRITDIHFVEKE